MTNILKYLVVAMGIYSCSSMPEQVNVNDKQLQLEQGILYYNNVLYTGTVVTTVQQEQLVSEQPYVKGRLHGVWKQWYSDGKQKEVRPYFEGIKVGVHRGWWPNGNRKFSYELDRSGRYDGAVKEWYHAGQPFKSFNYKKGKEEGRQQMFAIDGKVRANFFTINGERFGKIGVKKCYEVTANDTTIK